MAPATLCSHITEGASYTKVLLVDAPGPRFVWVVQFLPGQIQPKKQSGGKEPHIVMDVITYMNVAEEEIIQNFIDSHGESK